MKNPKVPSAGNILKPNNGVIQSWLNGCSGLAVSNDGKNVYTVSKKANSLVYWNSDQFGTNTQVEIMGRQKDVANPSRTPTYSDGHGEMMYGPHRVRHSTSN